MSTAREHVDSSVVELWASCLRDLQYLTSSSSTADALPKEARAERIHKHLEKLKAKKNVTIQTQSELVQAMQVGSQTLMCQLMNAAAVTGGGQPVPVSPAQYMWFVCNRALTLSHSKAFPFLYRRLCTCSLPARMLANCSLPQLRRPAWLQQQSVWPPHTLSVTKTRLTMTLQYRRVSRRRKPEQCLMAPT